MQIANDKPITQWQPLAGINKKVVDIQVYTHQKRQLQLCSVISRPQTESFRFVGPSLHV